MERYENNRYPEIYVLCRSWKDVKDGILGTEKEVIVGDSEEPIKVEAHFFYTTKDDEPVIKVGQISRKGGKVKVAIPLAMQTRHVTREVPLDDLVDSKKLTNSIL